MSTLHGAPLSPYVRKVRIALAEKGVDYTLNPVIPFDPPDDFKKISPLGKIPVYTTSEGQNIPDSSVIIAYLERSVSDNPLYPADNSDFAKALFIEEYCDTVVVEATGPVFFQRLITPLLMGGTPDETIVAEALNEKLPPRLSYLNEQIGSNDYFVGNRFSVADLAITSPFVNLMHGKEEVDAGQYPNLRRYLDNMMSRPTIAPLIEEERAFAAGG